MAYIEDINWDLAVPTQTGKVLLEEVSKWDDIARTATNALADGINEAADHYYAAVAVGNFIMDAYMDHMRKVYR